MRPDQIEMLERHADVMRWVLDELRQAMNPRNSVEKRGDIALDLAGEDQHYRIVSKVCEVFRDIANARTDKRYYALHDGTLVPDNEGGE